MGTEKGFVDGKVTIPFNRFLGYDRGANGELIVNPEQAETVRSIYDMFLQKAHLQRNRQGSNSQGNQDARRQGQMEHLYGQKHSQQ